MKLLLLGDIYMSCPYYLISYSSPLSALAAPVPLLFSNMPGMFVPQSLAMLVVFSVWGALPPDTGMHNSFILLTLKYFFLKI